MTLSIMCKFYFNRFPGIYYCNNLVTESIMVAMTRLYQKRNSNVEFHKRFGLYCHAVTG
jgi:hypothetical protein